MTFYDRIRSAQRKKNSILCVGLDADQARLPEPFRSGDEGVLGFNRRIIEATQEFACAYKINLAFYEALGDTGMEIVRKTIRHIPGDAIIIGDAKRGDIGNTAEKYAESLLVHLKFHATTVNPYMGKDSVEPFLRDGESGAFILALTSNPGAKDFQYLKIGKDRRPLYENIVRTVKKWNVRHNCGLVVGATRPQQLKAIRAITREMPLLIPGVGTQGGDVASAVRYGCDRDGEMAIVNASRSIIYASPGDDFAEAARKAAQQLRDTMNIYRDKYF